MTTASVLMADAFEIQPYTPHCRVIRDEGAHALIGVSVGNGYFSAGRLHDLARWGLEHFDRVDFVYTDLYVAEMFEAFGYPPGEARRKAAKSVRGVRAKVRNAVTAADPDGTRLRWQPMSRFRADAAYQEIHRRLWRQLDEDDDFRALCDDLVGHFLSARGEAADARQRAVCLEYVCAELPLFLDTPAILRVPSSLVCYHQRLPMAELLYGRGAGLRASRNQGHAIVTPAAPPHTANSK
ncbi:tRNA-dependent cyclodipeptide synthase [Streptomyces sp. NPDC094038]|uniref:tRNA-dependent cyclodipeptide synthase n=1 Tax=Streptomyces sp. NPDC094038 TaxID=3366055 RepID=UPI00382DA7F3